MPLIGESDGLLMMNLKVTIDDRGGAYCHSFSSELITLDSIYLFIYTITQPIDGDDIQ